MKNEAKTRRILLRMDPKLYKQLKRYADKEEEGVVSRVARKAIVKFLEENK